MKKYLEHIVELSELRKDLSEKKKQHVESEERYRESLQKCEHPVLGHLGIDDRPRLAGKLDCYMCLCCGKSFYQNHTGTLSPCLYRAGKQDSYDLLGQATIIDCVNYPYSKQYLLESFRSSYIEESKNRPDITLEQFCEEYTKNNNLDGNSLKLSKK